VAKVPRVLFPRADVESAVLLIEFTRATSAWITLSFQASADGFIRRPQTALPTLSQGWDPQPATANAFQGGYRSSKAAEPLPGRMGGAVAHFLKGEGQF